MHVLCVAGARPNFMKVKPVLDALDAAGTQTTLVHTGQHYDPSMSDVFFRDLGLRQPDHHLGVGSGTHAEQTARTMCAMEEVLRDLVPDAVVVVGDVNSTMAAAVTGARAGCVVAHVEAGLRSRDWTMPEEINRVITDRVSDHLFAPSGDAVANLNAEGYRDDQIHLAGNVMIDTLLANLDRARRGNALAGLGVEPGGYGLITLHRPATVDDPEVFAGVLQALGEIANRLPLLFPIHPRTRRHIPASGPPSGVRLLEPAGYLDFIALEAGARLVLTDSGGVQEETTVLGVPCLTLRENTERPITVSEGTNCVVGLSTTRIIAEATRVLDDPPAARRPELWDGHAGERIAGVLLDDDLASRRRRPTDL